MAVELTANALLQRAMSPTVTVPWSACGWARKAEGDLATVFYLGNMSGGNWRAVFHDLEPDSGDDFLEVGDGGAVITDPPVGEGWYFWGIACGASNAVTLWWRYEHESTLRTQSGTLGGSMSSIRARLGGFGGGTDLTFAGSMAYVRIFDAALGTGDMLAESESDEAVHASVVADWPLASEATMLADISGEGQTLTAVPNDGDYDDDADPVIEIADQAHAAADLGLTVSLAAEAAAEFSAEVGLAVELALTAEGQGEYGASVDVPVSVRFEAEGSTPVSASADLPFQVLLEAAGHMPTTQLGMRYATLEEVKEAASIDPDDTDLDAQIERAIDAASRGVDAFCSRHFYQVSGTRHFEPCALRLIEFGSYNDLVELWSASHGEDEIPAEQLRLAPLNPTAGPEPRPYTGLVTSGRFRALVSIDGIWGWPEIPVAVRAATILQAQRLLKRREAPEGVAGFSMHGVVRISRLDVDVVRMLKPYRLLTVA